MTISMQLESKTLRVNDLALHYLEWGEADAPEIVCVHGYTGSADAFNVSVLGGGGNSRVSARRAQCPITWSPARA